MATESPADVHPDEPVPLARPVAFIAFQTDSQANGGLESFTEILRGTRGRRVVITQRESAFTAKWRALGCELHIVEAPAARDLAGLALLAYRARRVPALAKLNAAIAGIVRNAGARVVHCNDPAAFWYGGLGARAAGAAIVLNVRGTKEARGSYGLKWRVIRHAVAEIVGLSRDMTREIDEKVLPLTSLAPRAHTSFVYSAVDLERMRPASPEERASLRRELGLDSEAFVVLHVGIFNGNKNQLGVLEHAAPALLRELPRAVLAFVGDFHPDRDEVAARCEAAARSVASPEQVRFAGFTSAPERWYRAADVLWVTSRHEGLARAMIESLACGVPVVSFDISSAREILEDQACGRVVPGDDFAALARAVLELASDPELRARLGASGASFARERFAPRRCVEAYAALYERLAAARG